MQGHEITTLPASELAFEIAAKRISAAEAVGAA